MSVITYKCIVCNKEKDLIYSHNNHCKKCEKERLYQERVDKVLVKFESNAVGFTYINYGIYIYYNKIAVQPIKKFILFDKVSERRKELKLKTVENLLEDLEESQ